MAGKLLLDTSVVVEVFANDPAATRLLVSAEEVFLPAIALGELFYGAERSNRQRENRAQVEAFAAASAVVPCDEETALVYGELKNSLRAKGRPLPENDVWIAAIARQHGLTLVTRDAHFGEIEGLALLAW